MGRHLHINRLTVFVAVLAAFALVVTGLLSHATPANAEPHQHVAVGSPSSESAVSDGAVSDAAGAADGR